MKALILNILLLCHLGVGTVNEKNSPRAKENTPEVVFLFKTTELLRFFLNDWPASISAKAHVFPKGTVLSILPNEASGQKTYYQMDGAAEQPYTESIRLVAKGQHVITMWILNTPNEGSIPNSIKFKVVE